MNALSYLIQVNLYLLLFYLFYVVLLSRETFFKLNRFYLVGSALLSLIIPLIKADWVKSLFITGKVKDFTQSIAYPITTPVIERINTTPLIILNETWLTPAEWFWLIYLTITLSFTLNFLRKLYLVNKFFKKNTKGRALSFFRKIAVDDELEGKETIIRHEMVHARQLHSVDVIFFELFAAMNWFNPIVYFYKKSIKNIHEFIADDLAASTLEERSAYALLLVSNVFNTQPQQLTNNFFNQSLLKRRIMMLHKTKSRKAAILKYGLSVPLFAGMMIFSSASGTNARIIKNLAQSVTYVPTDQARLAKISKEIKRSELAAPKITVPIRKSSNEKYIPEIPKNLYDFASKSLESSVSITQPQIGMVYFSFYVNEHQEITEFRITKSIGSDWENSSLSRLKSFKEKVNLKEGTYNFYQFYGFGFYDENLGKPDKDSSFLFGVRKHVTIAVMTFDETKEDAGRIVNYLVGTTEPPVFILNDKEIEFKATPKGLKMSEYYDTTDISIFETYKGDEAVTRYNESARSGLIIVETKEYAKNKQK